VKIIGLQNSVIIDYVDSICRQWCLHVFSFYCKWLPICVCAVSQHDFHNK